MNLRCRGPDGQMTLTGLDPSMTVTAFQEVLSSRLGVPAAYQEVLAGFPPKPVQLPADADSAPLSSLGVANGDTIVIRRLPTATTTAGAAAAAATPSSMTTDATTTAAAPAAQALSAPTYLTSAQPLHQRITEIQESEDEQLARAIAASLGQESTSYAPSQAPAQAASHVPAAAAAPQHQGLQGSQNGSALSSTGSSGASVTLPDGTCVVRRKVDDDNSCLFSAVAYVMEGSRAHAQKLRQVIAAAVAADPFTFNDGFLGKPNAEYRKWILDPKKWGGAIELSIFAKHFSREIAAYDIQTRRCDVYGQGEGYQERAMLIYDGLHYDALALAAFQDAPEELDVTITETSSQHLNAVDQAAAALTSQANKARQFTDTASFTLRCGVCKIGVKGEKEAVAHAQATGHTDFSEYH